MDEFPTKEELVERYKNEANDGNGLNEQELAIIEPVSYTHLDVYKRQFRNSVVCRAFSVLAGSVSKISNIR